MKRLLAKSLYIFIALTLVTTGVVVTEGVITQQSKIIDSINTLSAKTSVIKTRLNAIEKTQRYIFNSLLDTKSKVVKNKKRIEAVNKDSKIADYILSQSVKKPTYSLLKKRTVYIVGEVPKKVTYSDGILNVRVREAWAGTGIVIKKEKGYTLILTNAHVAGKGKDEVLLNVKEGDNYYPATVIKFHKKLDMALLLVFGDLKDKVGVKKISTTLRPQNKVYCVGNYLGMEYFYSEGTMAGVVEGEGIAMNLPVCYGNSGSGVYNQDGDLVAIVFAIFRVGYTGVDTAKAICVRGSDIEKFVGFLVE